MTSLLSISSTPNLQLATDPKPLKQAGKPDWIPITEAASLMRISEGHLRRRCPELKECGHAKQMKGANGHKVWHIHWCVDHRLNSTPMPGRDDDLAAFTDKHRNKAGLRSDAVKRFRRRKAAERRKQSQWVPAFLKELAKELPALEKVTLRSLQRWSRQLDDHGLVGLIDTRGGNQTGDPDPAAWEFFKSVYFTERQTSLTICHELTAREAKAQGWRWVSSVHAARRLKDSRVGPADEAFFRDPKTHSNQFATRLEHDPEAYAAGQMWMADSAQFDFWVQDEQGKAVRPWLCVFQDWRTRKIVGWGISIKPDTQMILNAFRMAMLDESNMGGPDESKFDNGKDYDSEKLHGQTKKQRQKQNRNDAIRQGLANDLEKHFGIFRGLGIIPSFSLPYNPTGKARVERFFKTMRDRFDKLQKSYAGNGPGKSPQATERIRIKHPEKLLTLDQIKTEFGYWVGGYNQKPSSIIDMKGASPNQYYAEHAKRRRVFKDPEALQRLLAYGFEARNRTVGKYGITLNIKGASLKYGQFAHELRPYKGSKRKVTVRYNPDDLRSIIVFDEQGRYLCDCDANKQYGSGPISQQDVKEGQKKKAEYRKAQKAMVKTDHYAQFMPIEQLAADNAAENQNRRSLHLPKQVVQTQMDGVPSTLAHREALEKEYSSSCEGLTERMKRGNERNAREREKARSRALTTVDLSDLVDEPDDEISVLDLLSLDSTLPPDVDPVDEIEIDLSDTGHLSPDAWQPQSSADLIDTFADATEEGAA